MNAPAAELTRTSLSQPSLINHGFKRSYGNAASGYMLMFDGVGNESGRKIYVPGGEVGRRFAYLLTVGGKENLVLSRLSRLRSCAGGFQSYSNKRNAFEHVDLVENLRISYVIRQDSVGGLSPGVYITDVELVEHAEGHQPGFYHVRYRRDQWHLSPSPSNHLLNKYAAINGHCDNLKEAATNIMPPIIEDAYSGSTDTLESNGYTIAYNPPPLYRGGTEWTTPEQKQTSANFTATMLAQGIYKAQKIGREINWTITGNGSELMLAALRQLPPDLQLDKHTVFIGAPGMAANPLLLEMQRRGMSLAKDVTKTQTDDWTCVRSKMLEQFKTAGILEQWGGAPAEVAEKIRVQARIDGAWGFGLTASAFGTGFKIGSIAMGAPIISTFGGAAAVTVTAIGVLFGASKIRNIIANSSKSTVLNPHYHPTKSNVDFNTQVIKQSGGYKESFMALMREMRPKW
ncbi:hypothetical protein HCH_00400 [Hahella chejuensis KCTC 2396]|uniref:Transmembrane protein n=1 Tax=Hahella chejuensis (strain KCTC 2396) TaxID=349521 RepID=Q2SPW3_HAHCH|nr:hypothetical protein [Hahella chejuensis]ABC27311.1 hypothetical protein HCH_00400 [Hahella chejuensis KCTC 2396]